VVVASLDLDIFRIPGETDPSDGIAYRDPGNTTQATQAYQKRAAVVATAPVHLKALALFISQGTTFGACTRARVIIRVALTSLRVPRRSARTRPMLFRGVPYLRRPPIQTSLSLSSSSPMRVTRMPITSEYRCLLRV
jgi:hypothetical protein